jgi:hypothetical protein
MERLQNTTTRLRRTFTYDPDSDEDSTPSVMDEQGTPFLSIPSPNPHFPPI